MAADESIEQVSEPPAHWLADVARLHGLQPVRSAAAADPEPSAQAWPALPDEAPVARLPSRSDEAQVAARNRRRSEQQEATWSA